MDTETRLIYICCLQETHFTFSEVRGWKNIFHANRRQKKAGVAILISDIIVLKIKFRRGKEGHYIIMGSFKRKT